MFGRQPSLMFCIIMDLIGYASYAIPALGEISDIFWAPLSAIIFFLCFGGRRGILGAMGNFVEEILPGTDFIPSFTIMWFFQRYRRKVNTPPSLYKRIEQG